MDIKSLIEQYAGIRVVSEATVHGVREYHSNCPFPGCEDSTDGFITSPETGRYSHAIRSKGCGRTGDMIDFLQDYAGMTRREACEEIGIDPDELEFLRTDPAQYTLARDSSAPGKGWRDRAEHEIALAQARIRRPEGARGLAELRARGFSDEIILDRKLGYFPLTNGSYLRKDTLESWGLTYEEVKKEQVYVFEGIWIPWYVNGQIWKLEVRRLIECDPDQRTPEILGSHQPLYNYDAVQPGKPVVLCEGALDAISGIQVCGDLAAFVATGGAGKKSVQWIKHLQQASCVLIAFDDDKAGDDGAQFWLDNLPNAMRWVPRAHDLNDMLRERKDIRDWLTDGMEMYQESTKTEKLPVKPAAAPAQSQPLQGIEHRKQKTPYSYPELVSRVEMMQEQGGLVFSLVNGRVAVDAPYDLTANMQAFIKDHTALIVRWLQSKQPVIQTPVSQPVEQERSSSCCKCGEPAEHFAPLGSGYCTSHYRCADGHVPSWVKYQGRWVCRQCAAARKMKVEEA
jgi:5S rRNA maturation endonuclease (ribonuclease M5)